ncbi:hypothetical protein D0T85_11775 [Bacteroides sp. 519]|nr:hypothetical protein [Bacteroides sp. 519]
MKKVLLAVFVLFLSSKFHFNQEAIIFILLIAVSMIVGFIIKLRVLIPKEYKKVKSYLDKMENDKK